MIASNLQYRTRVLRKMRNACTMNPFMFINWDQDVCNVPYDDSKYELLVSPMVSDVDDVKMLMVSCLMG